MMRTTDQALFSSASPAADGSLSGKFQTNWVISPVGMEPDRV